MKQLFLLFFFWNHLILAQDFSQIDARVANYPKYKTPEELASRIQKDFTSHEDKVRAAFRWLTQNISYSLQLANNGKRTIEFRYSDENEKQLKLQKIRDQIVQEAFTRRIGVCEEFAQSLKKLCDLMAIESEVVKGNVRNSALEIGNTLAGTNHVWNLVKINDDWKIIDVTWASGYSINGKWIKDFSDYYYDIPKELIGKTHFPENKKWQILWGVNSKNSYSQQPIYYESFLKRNLSYPENTVGILSAKLNGKLSLEIKGLNNNDKVFIGYGNDRYSKQPTLIKSKFGNLITVPSPLSNTEMYVFINGRLATIFKVVVI